MYGSEYIPLIQHGATKRSIVPVPNRYAKRKPVSERDAGVQRAIALVVHKSDGMPSRFIPVLE